MGQNDKIEKVDSLAIAGLSPKQMKKKSLDFFAETGNLMVKIVDQLQRDAESLKHVDAIILSTKAGQQQAELEQRIKDGKKLFKMINNERTGALKLLKKQDINIEKDLKNMKMLPAGGEG